MRNYAYVSLMATNNYIGAAITMMEAGKQTKPEYPFYLMVTENITEENRTILEVLGYKLLEIKEWRPTVYDTQKASITDQEVLLGHGKGQETRGWQHVFSKILCGNLTQFDRVCFLDLDILLFKNIDDVFDLIAPAWLGPDVNGFSATQIFMIEPNATVFKKLVEFANHFEGNEKILFTDEGFIHQFFKEEVDFNKTIPLTYIYNGDRCCTDYTFVEDSFKIRGIHMTGVDKPWLHNRQYVANFSIEWYPAAFIWNYYISIYNLGVTKLNQKGFNLSLIN